MLYPKIVDEGYQMELKAQEKFMRKKSVRGKSNLKGRGSEGGRGRSITPIGGASNTISN